MTRKKRATTSNRPRRRAHVCTRTCLRWSVGFGMRFYYCNRVKPIVVRLPRLAPVKEGGKAWPSPRLALVKTWGKA